MAAQRKTTDERLEALRQRQGQLKAQLTALETRKKAEARKREMRRAFVVGAAALAGAQSDPAFRKALRAILETAVVRDGDRAVIADLLGLAAPSSAQPETEAA